MGRPLLLSTAAITLILSLGCLGIGNKDVEGDEAGECSDGADNDQNGLFDCDDEGCAGSPDCEEETEDTDSEGDTDTDADADTDTDTDADGDGDVDTDTDTDSEPDPAGTYQGLATIALVDGGEGEECTGEFELLVRDSGAAEGFAECAGGYINTLGHISGEVVFGVAFTGEIFFEGSYPFEGLEAELEGLVLDGAVRIEFTEEAGDRLVVGVLEGELRD